MEDLIAKFVSDKKSWISFISQQDGPFLQSWGWGDLQEKLGRGVKRLAIFNQETGNHCLLASMIKHNLPLGKNYFYSPRGPIIQNPKLVLELFLDEIKKIIGKKTIFLRVEPVIRDVETEKIIREDLKTLGFQETQPVQPKATLILDLKKSEEELLKGVEYETRYAIRVAQKRGVKIIKPQGLPERKKLFEDFWRLLQKTSQYHRFKIYPKNYYWQVLNLLGEDCRAKIFSANLNGNAIGTNIILFSGKTATYLYSASASGYGRFNAPTLLLWESILEAKKRGCQFFDFWGISASKDKNKKWAGFTAFKKSFGGEEINYLGTWDYVFNKRFYFLYKIAKNLL